MLRVLVVDSDTLSAKRIASALNKSGFEVLLASAEPEGLTRGERVFPDAISDSTNQLACDWWNYSPGGSSGIARFLPA